MAEPMQEKFTALTPALYDYLVAHNPPPDPVLRDLAAETAALGPISRMQIAVEQGALLTFLARLLGARRALEIGTFTGHSAISIARGLVPDGTLQRPPGVRRARRPGDAARGRRPHAGAQALRGRSAFASGHCPWRFTRGAGKERAARKGGRAPPRMRA
jgi:hypothetical protein